jgi:hypothetical protein
MYSYPASSFRDLFSLNIGLKVSINAAASLLSFVIAALAIVPNINIANALDNNAQPANSNNLAGSHTIGKQTSGSDEKADSKDDETVSPSKQSSPDDSILLHFPVPVDHNDQIKSTNDEGNHEKHNDQGSAVKDNNNDNENSKRKDTSTNTTPLYLPFP